MNTNDHRDKEERLREDEGREDRVAPEIAHGCKHGDPRKAEPGPECMSVDTCIYICMAVDNACFVLFLYVVDGRVHLCVVEIRTGMEKWGQGAREVKIMYCIQFSGFMMGWWDTLIMPLTSFPPTIDLI